jgi:hypothetical protein
MIGMRGKRPVALCAVHLEQFDAMSAALYAGMNDIKHAARCRGDGRAN